MSTPNTCPRCGASLPPGLSPESCPRCLIQVGLEKSAPGGETLTSHGSALPPPPAPEELADDFPQLEILELLGQGGMGVVYRARQKSLDRMVALKILAVPQSAGPDFAERFAREARALASLSHPSIVTVHDFGEAGGRYFLLMEYVDGANLHQLIRSGRILPRQALQIVSQVCEALQFAHDAGVVHRDIKPENILVDEQGRVKIADFGLAKILRRTPEDIRLTGAGQVMGTAHYMAPEQLEHPLDVDHRVDIYSLGVVFYELLTGELPIGRFQPPSNKIDVDVRVDEVVLKTLAKEPQRRYQHASEIKAEVDGISGEPPRQVPRAVAGVPGWAWFGLAGLFLVVALAVPGAALLLWMRDSAGEGSAGGVGVGQRASVSAASGDSSGGSTATTEGSEVAKAGAERTRNTPLIVAAARGQIEMVPRLLEAGTDVNAQGSYGTTALIEAIDRGHAQIAAILLDAGADPNLAQDSGTTALIIACARGNASIVARLLAVGAEVDRQGTNGTTALIEAADRGHSEIAYSLLDRGADPNLTQDSGLTALMMAAARGNTDLVVRLLEAGADVAREGPGGTTALVEAVDRGHEEIATLLLEAGAK